MDIKAYYKSLSSELSALRKRVRNFIDDAHWPTDGEWKESVLRTAMRRSLPDTIRVGRGFIVDHEECSRQIDVLVYDSQSPVFFRDGDLVILPPEFVRAVIEVKTRLERRNLNEALNALSHNRSHLPEQARARVLVGVFAYESRLQDDTIAQSLREACETEDQLVDMLCAGPSRFVRYWDVPPDDGDPRHMTWHSYRVAELAFGYFIHNLITHLTPEYAGWRGNRWFPREGKEHETTMVIPAPWGHE